MIEKEVSLSITPFSSEIIGADNKYVYLKEDYFFPKDMPEMEVGVSYSFEDLEKPKTCVIKVLRKYFIVMCNLWLDRKAEYCKSGEFCGVFGNFHIEKYKDIGTINILTGSKGEIDVDFELIYEDIPLFEVISFDEYCDMEHG